MTILGRRPLKHLALGFGALAFLVGTAALGGVFQDRTTTVKEPPPRAMPVSVDSLKKTDGYDVERFFTGQVVARRSSDLGFERAGKIEAVFVDEGETVAKGAPIARLDTGLLEVQLKVADAQVQAAEAVQAELKAGVRTEVLEQARARVRERKAEVEEIELRHKRVAELLGRKVAAQSEFDEIERQMIAAEARLSAAKHILAEFEAGTRKEKIAAQAAVVAQSEARVAELKLEIAKSTLVSPYEAIVSVRELDEGTVVAGGMRVVRLVEATAPEARIGVPLVVVDHFVVGSKVRVIIGSHREEALVVSLLPELDPTSRTRTLFLQLTGSHAPGGVVRLIAKERIDTEGFWLPITALAQAQRGLWSCYAVIEEGGMSVLSRRIVEVIYTDGERAFVRGTLGDGDRIVRGGTDRVVVGQRVEIVEAR